MVMGTFFPVIEGGAPRGFAAGGGDASPNNSGADIMDTRDGLNNRVRLT